MTEFKKILDAKGFTPYLFSKKAGLPTSNIYNLLNGTRKPENLTLQSLEKIAIALEMPLADIVELLKT